jgi:uncharacterized protein YjbI with pentapeptide repeats
MSRVRVESDGYASPWPTRLNVGGVRFETTLTTLCRFPESMLATMFLGSDRINVPLDADGFVFIDRNHECFAAVLDFYRTGEVDWPTDSTRRRALLREFDFYALEPPPDHTCRVDPFELRRLLSTGTAPKCITAVELSAMDFTRFDFSHLVLRGARFKHAVLADAKFNGATLSHATLCHADLQRADLRGADLRGADLRGADLRGADLRGADFDNVNMSNADLRHANLYGARLLNANLSHADLRGVQLDAGTDMLLLGQIHIDRYSRRPTNYHDTKARDLSTCVFDGANLTDSLLVGPTGLQWFPPVV